MSASSSIPPASIVSVIGQIAPVDYAIRISGDAGARLTLDIPDSEVQNLLPLWAMRGKLIRITIELADRAVTLSRV